MLRTRHAASIRLDDPVFADTLGGFRDPSNTRRALPAALSPVGNTARPKTRCDRTRSMT